ncbi:MAG: ATP-binding protein [Verrucomicrobiota bacterium]|nr:ATP-binding protein [Verrucomicrobiota bacterium]
MKFFNTAGPVNKEIHYKLDPIHRWDLDEILSLIEQEKYFILHAPRQTGKTSSLLALQEKLNKEGDYISVYVNVECAQTARNDVYRGIRAILAELGSEASDVLDDFSIRKSLLGILEDVGPENGLIAALEFLSKKLDRPLILFIDEIDSLIGDTLVSVLRQLRTGYKKRPGNFPQSIILCGVVDIKDYKIHRSDGEIITGGSCFNIKSKSLRLGNFNQEEIKELYLKHTTETGQKFDDAVFDLAWYYTGGQPWLVNALAYEACFEIKENRDRSIVVTPDVFEKAKENLILSRQTHLDQLADKLTEERVRRVIEPMILGADKQISNEDKTYCFDLGLIKKTKEGYVISNRIYQEVLPRELTNPLQDLFLSKYKNPKWINNDESINTENLLTMFVQFWRENSDIWKDDLSGYLEAAPHLVFQGFLQRVANGHGSIEREYALGNGRVDLYLNWKGPNYDQRIIFELKIRTEKTGIKKIKEAGLKQTAEYADFCNATESHLIIFDRRKDINWSEKIYTENQKYNQTEIKIWGM